jgi:hypothetical protein
MEVPMLAALGLLTFAVLEPGTPPPMPDAMYVIEGSVVQTGETRLATVVWPQEEMGLMSMRVEVDCAQQRWRPLQITFYDADGSLRRSTGRSDVAEPITGWATRNGARIAARACPRA